MIAETHWLSRISPKPQWSPRDLVALGGLDPYGQHQTLCRLFDQPVGGTRDRGGFLFRAEVRDGLPLFYVLSHTPPRDDAGKWRIEPKQYRPALQSGDRLAFTLRANPILSRPGDGGGRGRRHDVVMDAKRRMGWKDLPDTERPPLAHLAYGAGSRWLREREEKLGCRFNTDPLRVDGYHVHRMQNRRGIVLATLEFTGELEVTDPERFLSHALCNGIGPAKAFGCGLMLVRRA